MLLVAYWLAPWAIILVLEHFVFRRGRYNVEDWNTPGRLPIGWAAIVSMAIGLLGAYLGFAQVLILSDKVKLTSIPGINVTSAFCGGGTCGWAITGLVGGLINKPFGMDVGFELGLVLAGIAYLILRRIELNTSRREEVAA
jgi:purine-cytosine permease-like protein